MMNKFWCFLLFIFTVNSFANDNFAINGKVLTEQGKPLTGVEVTVGDEIVTTSQDGTFLVKAKVAGTYQVVLSHPHYFPSVQTFSHFELAQASKNIQNISDITLVG